MNYYLDSSVLLRHLLGHSNRMKLSLSKHNVVSNELIIVEANRVLERYRLENLLDDSQIAILKNELRIFLRGIDIIKINSDIIKRASESFPTIIRSLDAIHLSSAILWQKVNNENIIILTHDHQFQTCAKALGFKNNG